MNKILDIEIEKDIVELAKRYNLEEVILFGSRTDGTAHEKSDIDIAVKGYHSDNERFEFEEEVWKIPTLLMFDIVDLDSNMIDESLRKDIAEKGRILWKR